MDLSSARQNNEGKQTLFVTVVSTVMLVSMMFLVVDCEVLVPQQGWSQRWGPLVPHEKFPGDCGICHVSEKWDVLRENFSFDHEKETGHPLVGAHTGAACLRCHNDRGPVEAYVTRGCGGCHADPHKSNLGFECTRCHDENTWRPGGLITEHARTRFPLLGAHISAPCESCHERAPVQDFRGAPTQCDLCHQDDLQRASSPNHLAAGWTRNCDTFSRTEVSDHGTEYRRHPDEEASDGIL